MATAYGGGDNEIKFEDFGLSDDLLELLMLSKMEDEDDDFERFDQKLLPPVGARGGDRSTRGKILFMDEEIQ